MLLLVAAIWGTGFVAQRLGVQAAGAFWFNALRFAIGGAIAFAWSRAGRRAETPAAPQPGLGWKILAAGALLFAGTSLQTAGLGDTSAGKAGFITGLYVVLVPLLGLVWGQRTGAGVWLGALLAVTGLYFLTIQPDAAGGALISTGDLLVFLSAFFWAGHVQYIGYASRRVDPLTLSAGQFGVVAVLSLAGALLFERHVTAADLGASALPILYGGVMTIGVAFTLQVVGQRGAHPAAAAVIFSLEAVFAVLSGWLVLGEQLSGRALFGCALMLAGMLAAQLEPYLFRPVPHSQPEL